MRSRLVTREQTRLGLAPQTLDEPRPVGTARSRTDREGRDETPARPGAKGQARGSRQGVLAAEGKPKTPGSRGRGRAPQLLGDRFGVFGGVAGPQIQDERR